MDVINMNKLDLHGVRHVDVENTVKRFIEDNWVEGEPVEIITGQSPTMRMLVARVIQDYDLSFKTSYINGWTGAKPTMIIEF